MLVIRVEVECKITEPAPFGAESRQHCGSPTSGQAFSSFTIERVKLSEIILSSISSKEERGFAKANKSERYRHAAPDCNLINNTKV